MKFAAGLIAIGLVVAFVAVVEAQSDVLCSSALDALCAVFVTNKPTCCSTTPKTCCTLKTCGTTVLDQVQC